MSRKSDFKKTLVVSVRIEEEDYLRVKEIADIESYKVGKYISAQDLIRDAINYVYSDNERLRECFRRTRSIMTKRIK